MTRLLNGYKIIWMPEHNRVIGNSGCVYEHVIMAEKKLGRPLKEEEVVHHKDLNRSNNSPDNLMIFASKADHTSFHNNGGIYYQDEEGICHTIKKEKVNHCVDCGCIISHGAKRCVKCDHVLQRKVNRPDKEALYEKLHEVKNFKKVGDFYGVTDNTVRKWCKNYNLPYKTSDYKPKQPPKTKREPKLSSEDILYIKENYKPGDKEFGARALGRKFNVDHSTIVRIGNK